MKTSKNETYLTGNETKLYTFNQARDEVNASLEKSFSLQTFGELMRKSGVRPAYITASETTSGLYSYNDLQQFMEAYKEGKVKEGREKKEKVVISAEEYAILLKAKEEAEKVVEKPISDAE